jgi:uridine kinase
MGRSVALLISGYIRSFTDVFASISENLIEPNTEFEFDIFLHFSKENSTGKYRNDDVDLGDINKMVKCKTIIIDNSITFNDNIKHNDIYCQNYKIYILNQYKNQRAIIEDKQYDIVFRIRPDVYLQSKIILNNIENDVVYIPKNSKIDKNKLQNIDDPYTCDILAYGSNDIMNKYFDYFNHLDELIRKYDSVNETLLWYYLKNNMITIKEFNICFTVVLSKCNTIAITGDSGSGKTTLSNILINYFSDSVLLECDRYHKWERGDNNWEHFTHLNPESNYLMKMQEDVFDLKLGKDIYQVDYDHSIGKFTTKQLIESKNNVIICGLHSLYLDRNIVDLKIYMDTQECLRLYWKITRDMKLRNYNKEKIVEQINKRSSDFNKYILPQKENADIIINIYCDNFNFNIDDIETPKPINLQYRIGINNSYNISNIINGLSEITQVKKEDSFNYLYFNNIDTLYPLIIELLNLLKRN